MPNKVFLLWHTIRYLKPIQFYRRIWFKLTSPKLDLAVSPVRARPTGKWTPCAKKHSRIDDQNTFNFLNVQGTLDELGWDGPQLEKLWRYNQHYFDYLSADNSFEKQNELYSILENWLIEVAPGVGDGWEPYPTSLRIVNWVKWSLDGNELPEGFDRSLYLQARWLMKRLEFHLLGNHLFANAKALVFAGLYFNGKEAAAWLKKGLHILVNESNEQVLPDGGHFERSPMYHAIAFEDILDLCNITECYGVRDVENIQECIEIWLSLLPKMKFWLYTMTHPDCSLSLFNDTAAGIAPEYSELSEYYKRLLFNGKFGDKGYPREDTSLSEHAPSVSTGDRIAYTDLGFSGYIRVRAGLVDAILDVAPIGPDYLPGHAHADTLSFELSLDHQRLFVNSGTSCYGDSAERLRQRGTEAHNTVVVNGENSSEVWSGFRVGRRARISNLKIHTTKHKKVGDEQDSLSVSAGHNGYTRLAGKPIHNRNWRFKVDSFLVSDLISGGFHKAEARYYLHPDVKLSYTSESSKFHLDYGFEKTAKISVLVGVARVEQTTWHPEFGVSIPNQCLVVKLVDAQSELLLSF